jgi:ATP-dependent DNA helicase RecG
MDIDGHEMDQLLQQGETLRLEFKSDSKRLSDSDLVAAVVAMANTEGGNLLLGVEDNGAVTGLHPTHQDLNGLAALIANRTNPTVSVRVFKQTITGHDIAQIQVPKSRQIVATSAGASYRRRIKLDNTPENVPFFPHEFIQRQSSLGIVDPSALVLEEVDADQLDPLQRLRLRNAIRKYGGDSSLLSLTDTELDAALGLCRSINGSYKPTVAGLLLLGTEELLRIHLPTHEVAFQVLRGTDVQVNHFYRKALLETFAEVESQFKPWVIEEEIQIGLFRVPVPNYDSRAFREAMVNALVHRDFSRMGAVHIKIADDGLSISSPGGFVEGVTLDNLLVADPRSRNQQLADAIKRIGLAERTGRGIDRIYEGMLRYGRPAPDYSLSSDSTVSVYMSNARADLEFLQMVVEQEETLGTMPVDTLIVLSRLREERRLNTADLAASVQKPEAGIRVTVGKLVEAGFLEVHGTGRSRTYTLSAHLYQQTGQKAKYIRQTCFAPLQQEQRVLAYIDKHGSIKRADVMELCRLSSSQAYRLLSRLRKEGKIHMEGKKSLAIYTRKK